jgi:hypothetical protein
MSFIKNRGNSALKARDKNPALEKKTSRKPLVSIISLYIYHYICNIVVCIVRICITIKLVIVS